MRAKFTYSGYEAYMIKRSAEGGGWEDVEVRTLKFAPVFANNDPTHENSVFWRASPGGEIKLSTVNQEAWSQFDFGKEYYVDFTRAP